MTKVSEWARETADEMLQCSDGEYLGLNVLTTVSLAAALDAARAEGFAEGRDAAEKAISSEARGIKVLRDNASKEGALHDAARHTAVLAEYGVMKAAIRALAPKGGDDA